MASIEELLNEVVVAPKVKTTTTTEESNIESLLNEVVPQATPEQIEKQTKAKEREEALDEISAFKKFNYGIDSTDNILTNASLWLESKFPLGVFGRNGTFYTSPDELYGEGFTDLSEDERREVLVKHRQKELKQEYPILSALSKDGSVGYEETLGMITKILVDPTILFPVGQTFKAATATGTAIGALYSTTEDLATVSGEIDKEKLAYMSAFGGIASGLISKGLQVFKKRKVNKKEMEEANIKMEEINNTISVGISKNVSAKDMPKYVQDELGMTAEDLIKTLNNTSIPLKTPMLPQARVEQELLKLHKKNSQGQAGLFTDKIIGNISTRVKNISPLIFGKLRKHEFNVSVKTHSELEIIKNFTRAINRENKKTRNLINMHLHNGNYNAVANILRKRNPDIATEISKVRNLLAKKQKDLEKAGYEINVIENYFPSKVKDLQGLRKSLNVEQRGALNKALYERVNQLKLNSIKELPDEEVNKIINQTIRGFTPKVDGAGLGFTKSRKIDQITEDMGKYYEEPSVALTNYIRQSVNDIERRTFLGRLSKKTTPLSENIDESVGNYVRKEIERGNLDVNDVDELSDLLTARFGMGEKSPNRLLKFFRDFGYGVTLGNPLSAMVQFGDIGVSAWMQGNRNTIASLLGNRKVTMKELGLDDIMSHELNNAIDTSRILGEVLKFGGFRAADRYGKNVLLTGAYKKATKAVQSEAGTKALSKKYKAVFGDDEFNMLVNELRKGEVTDRVKFYLWNELSDAQPISMTEMPEVYLNSPNGRILYALKSFTIKQLDLLRRRVIQEYKAGNKLKAGRNLAGYVLLVGGLNGTVQETKDWVLGRGFNIEDIPDNSMNHLYSLMAASQYVQDRYLKQGDIYGAGLNLVAPPLQVFSDIGRDISNLINKGDTLPEKTLKNLPIFGKLWYNFFGGGLENALERQEAKRREDD